MFYHCSDNSNHSIHTFNENTRVGAEQRFALATSLPKHCWNKLIDLSMLGKKHGDKLKVHFSLHYTTDEMRSQYMPHAMDIETSLKTLDLYQQVTGGEVEIHYALMDGINDTIDDSLRQ